MFETLHFRGSDKILKKKKMLKDVELTLGYIEGVLTKGDADMVKKGWHEDCEIVIFKNGKLQSNG